MIPKLNCPKGRTRKLCAIMSVLAIFPAMLYAQTNPNPYGFEDNTTANWSAPNSTETIAINTNPAFIRTGSASGKFTTTSTSSNRYIQNYNLYESSTSTTYVHFIFWALGTDAVTSVDASMRYATTNPPTGSGSSANATSSVLNTTTWQRLSFVAGGSNGRYYFTTPRRASGNATSFYMDDMIIYSTNSNVTDLTKPNTPSALSATANGSDVNLNWTSNTDAATGVQATIILRSSNTAATAPVLNDQAKYAATGGSDGTMTISDWTVISTTTGATATTFTDSSVAGGNYIYAVVLRDLAYNYSVAATSPSVIVGTPLAISIKDFHVTNKGSYNQIGWQVANAERYDELFLERSTDGNIYTTIKEFAAQTGETLFNDNNITSKNYYRLRLTSANKLTGYSNTLYVVCHSKGNMHLSPNPTANRLSFIFEQKESGYLIIRDMKGNVALSISFIDQDNMMLDLQELAAGYYIADVVGSSTQYHASFLKQ